MCVYLHMMRQIAQTTWKALADPVRREILDLLREESRTTGDICGAFPHLTRFGVLNHMAVLKKAGLLRVEQRGRERVNHIEAEPLRAAYEDWIRNYEVLWAGRLGRLKKFVDGKKEKRRMMPENPLPIANLVTLNIEQTLDFKAPPAELFRALTLDIGEWWATANTPADVRDVVFDPTPGGIVKQVTRDGGGTVLFTVQSIQRDRLLVLNGTLGIDNVILGTVRLELETVRGGGTRLLLKHWAIGELAPTAQEGFTKGWKGLLDDKLRAYVEHDKSLGVRAR
jgi:uncharacterized protein YndB with AHSA1/START domain/DNA-binding transcriptional ArsR family regulator